VYTIRHVWPEKGQVDIDFVRHAGGIAATWAERARPGDRIGFIGPVGGQSPVADWMLLGGDETAIPAIGRILENLPDTTIGHVRIHVPTLERTLPLKAPAQMQLEWVIGENGDALVDAMQAIDVPVTPAGTAFVWFAAEQSMATLYRKYLKHTLKMPAQAYTCAGYWQRKQ
jgi:NADPH-dependent ferric siderophore reductase